MFEYLVVFTLGLFVGWNFPQPTYIKNIIDALKNKKSNN